VRCLVALLLVVAACSGPATVTPTATVAPTATTTPSPLVNATPSPGASLTPSPVPATPTPTATTRPTAPATAAYCAVGDDLTPQRDYARHAETALDWTNGLPESYVPPDFVGAINGGPAIAPRGVEPMSAADRLVRRGDPAYAQVLADDPKAVVRAIIYPDLAAMRRAANAAGLGLFVISAYRSYGVQRLTFDYWVNIGGYEQALRTSARPGHSEHQLGTTIDFGDGSAAPWEYEDWATTPTGAWLSAHAAEYGFTMSLAKGMSGVTCYDYEPWHYRWVGRELAITLVPSGPTLREHQGTRR
jgi:LAS superfamily LD-carboxypeptidase LdcB